MQLEVRLASEAFVADLAVDGAGRGVCLHVALKELGRNEAAVANFAHVLLGLNAIMLAAVNVQMVLRVHFHIAKIAFKFPSFLGALLGRRCLRFHRLGVFVVAVKLFVQYQVLHTVEGEVAHVAPVPCVALLLLFQLISHIIITAVVLLCHFFPLNTSIVVLHLFVTAGRLHNTLHPMILYADARLRLHLQK